MRLLATLLAAVLYGIGWVAGIVAVALAWLWSALAVGWDDAHRLAVHGRQRPSEGDVQVPAWPAERPKAA